MIVYTAADNRAITPQTAKGRYLAFTPDKPPRPWVRRTLPFLDNPCLNAKAPKVFPRLFLGGHFFSLWIDANFRLKVEPERMEKLLGQAPLALFKHPLRSHVSDEVDAVVALGKDGSRVKEQYAAYLARGFRDDVGLWCGGVILRTNQPITIAFSLLWWNEIVKWSLRDQISLPYVLWKLQITPTVIPGNIYDNEFVEKIG